MFNWGKNRDMFYLTDNLEYRNINYYDIIKLLLDSDYINLPLPMVKNIFTKPLEIIQNNFRSIIEDSNIEEAAENLMLLKESFLINW